MSLSDVFTVAMFIYVIDIKIYFQKTLDLCRALLGNNGSDHAASLVHRHVVVAFRFGHANSIVTAAAVSPPISVRSMHTVRRPPCGVDSIAGAR